MWSVRKRTLEPRRRLSHLAGHDGGWALTRGLTDWGLANGLGDGNSDAIHAGLRHYAQRSRLFAGAASFTEYWIATDRFALAGDHLTARFNGAELWRTLRRRLVICYVRGRGRTLCGGARRASRRPRTTGRMVFLAAASAWITTPAMAAKHAASWARFDQALPVARATALALSARAAWAHDWVTNPLLMPVFQTLPGASSIVDGATIILSLGLDGSARGCRASGTSRTPRRSPVVVAA